MSISFNSQQTKVVSHKNGPLLVLSPPGSGKTMVLVGRTKSLIDSGIRGRNILLLTYSRQAALEMASRIDIGDVERPICSTFHAFGYRLIRKNPAIFGREKGVTIMDSGESAFAIRELIMATENRKALTRSMFHYNDIGQKKEILASHQIGFSTASNYYNLYTNVRAMRLLEGTDHFDAINLCVEEPLDGDTRKAICRIFTLYEEMKVNNNRIDFDDAIFLLVSTFRSNTGFARSLGLKHTYIMCDEAQDMDSLQYEIIKHIGHHDNIVLVGDDDQTIHEHRGANPALLDSFRKEYKARFISFEKNYRSPAGIVGPAGALIANNELRIKKNMYATREMGSRMQQSITYSSDATHADMVDRLILNIANQLKHDNGCLSDHVILYRNHALSNVVIKALENYGIEYQTMKAATRDRNPLHIMIFLWLIRIGLHQDIDAITRLARAFDIKKPLLTRTLTEFRRKNDHRLRDVFETSRYSTIRSFGQTVWQVIDTILSLTPTDGYDYLESNFIFENIMSKRKNRKHSGQKGLDDNDIQIIKEQRDRIDQYITQPHISRLSLHDQYLSFEDEMFLSTGCDSGNQYGVCLGTLHASKGREFKHVHLICASESLSPYYTKTRPLTTKTLESERRLFYVGVTRAQISTRIYHSCTYACPPNRTYKQLDPSRFVRELNLI